MVDIVENKTRSRMMSGIRGKDTNPELLVRKALFRRGFRYRLHLADLPGKPDLVFQKYKAIILINGCFWHGHMCHLFKWPKSHTFFWKNKINATILRDQKNHFHYKRNGYKTLVVWECALKGKYRYDFSQLIDMIEKWLIFSTEDMVIPSNTITSPPQIQSD